MSLITHHIAIKYHIDIKYQKLLYFPLLVVQIHLYQTNVIGKWLHYALFISHSKHESQRVLPFWLGHGEYMLPYAEQRPVGILLS